MLFGSLNTKLWVGMLFSSLQLWVRLPASTARPPSPRPTLDLFSRSLDSSVLVCRAPGGLRGVHFALYRAKETVPPGAEKMDFRDVPLGAEEVHFPVPLRASSQPEHYCCLYKTQEGSYSDFSPYLQLYQQTGPDPSRPLPPQPGQPLPPQPGRPLPPQPGQPLPPQPDPPVLSVQPSDGRVKRGEVLSFHCSLPPPLPQYQVTPHNGPVSFLLLRGGARGFTSTVPQPQSSPSSSPEPQPGVFSVGPVTGAEQGQYSCLYQVNRGGHLQNSTVSNMVQVTVTDLLPRPSLLLQLHSDVYHLVCSGSPSYPGALFSLLTPGSALPVSSHQASVTQHQAVFSVPVQDAPVALYQCEYSVLLGAQWAKSEPSPALSVTQDIGPAQAKDSVALDWPLILGSLSAVVLFLCAVALLIVVLHRKVKATAQAKQERQGAQFWTQVHGKDHIVDLPLHRSSFTSQDWGSGHTESASRSNLWNPLSTFTTPVVPNY